MTDERAAALDTTLLGLRRFQATLERTEVHQTTIVIETLFHAQGLWLDRPHIARILHEALAIMLDAAERGEPTRGALRTALNFLQKRLPRVPEEDREMLGIPPAQEPDPVVLTGKGLPMRKPGAALRQVRPVQVAEVEVFRPKGGWAEDIDALKDTIALIKAIPAEG